MNIIEFKNVNYCYSDFNHALRNVSLSIKPGSFVAIVGSNGSGKSTLARCINALVVPDSGQVIINGYDTQNPNNTYLIRQNVGMVFQNPDDQIVSSVVEDEVAFGPENLGVYPDELRERVSQSLEKVGLSGYELRSTHALSGGQKQRLAIAAALAMQPRILVLDEASSMLDPRGAKSLMRLCKKLNEDGITIVLVTHFMDEAALADRVIALHDGAVALDGSPAEVLTDTDALKNLCLKPPFAVSLSEAIRKACVPVETELNLEKLAKQLRSLIPKEELKIKIALFSKDTNCHLQQIEPKQLMRFDKVSYSYNDNKYHQSISTDSNNIGNDCNIDARRWGGVRNNKWAVKDISFSVDVGDFIGIAGHTGSGKSTLIQLAAGLTNPSSGKLYFNGQDLSDKKVKRRLLGSTIGYLFQYPENQLFAPTVFEDVAFGPKNLGLKGDDLEKRVILALESVGLDDVAQNSPFELSGGQQRRVALAGVLAMSPSVLILDEPTAGLDPTARDEIMYLLAHLHTSSNITMILVSHSMDSLAKFCNKIVILNRGEVAVFGSPPHVFRDPELLDSLGLSLPSVLQFLNMLEYDNCPEQHYDAAKIMLPHIPTIDEIAKSFEKVYSEHRRSNTGDTDE